MGAHYSRVTGHTLRSVKSNSSNCFDDNATAIYNANNKQLNKVSSIGNMNAIPLPPALKISEGTVASAESSPRASSILSASAAPSTANLSTSVVAPASAVMSDEYGKMDSSGHIYHSNDFALESGCILPEVQVCYNTFGSLNSDKSNLIVVCHALTGNSRADQWWSALIGHGKALDTSKYCILCANILGSCYGTTGPTSINPMTGMSYGNSFPEVTIRDTVTAHMDVVIKQLGVSSIACVVGGSMGGMQALEWGLIGGDMVRSCIVIGCGAAHTAWQIGIGATQRLAIKNDPNWRDGNIDPANPPSNGLSLARQIAMISYRTAHAYQTKFSREKDATGQWQVQRYLNYQGEKFIDRFDAISYIKITEQMDTHDVGRNRGGVAAALAQMKAKVLVIGIDSDILYPLEEQQQLAHQIKDCTLKLIKTMDGHDGFLLEHEQVEGFIKEFFSGSGDVVV